MSASKKIIFITGFNKGIDYTIAENLINQNVNLNIIFTVINNNLGKVWFNKLKSKYPKQKDLIKVSFNGLL